ncbi:MAG: LacI family transcriptional regulator [Actinomycetota bacterium]|nr:LacI family transcriptional regulator [Actinomycetota bacterium]
MRTTEGRSGEAGTRPRPVTMQDIAREAGVSQSTVSRVLNDTPTSVPIAPDTRERVQGVAQRLGYRPNPLARGLRGARTMLLGVIVRDITDPFFAMGIEALSTEALARGYNVVLGSAHSKADEAIALRAVLETRHCDAIVLLGDLRDEPKFLEDLRASQTPMVALWHGTELEGVPTVNIDNRAGVVVALDHLLAFGHTKIAFIGGRPLGDIRERRTAFTEHLEAKGHPAPDDRVRNVTNDPAGGADALRALFALDPPPTAIICSTDHLAIGVLHAAAELGLHVPDDLSVVGFDDIPIASFMVPPLTTVHMPIAEMIAVAARLAMDEIEEESEAEVITFVAEPSLVVRKSTGEAPRR